MTKTLIILTTTALMTAFLLAPAATADHGLTGTLVADNGLLTADLQYAGGIGNAQTWTFTWGLAGATIVSCDGLGSIEVGFTSQGCPIDWSTGPTGDFHPYPNCAADTHEIDYTFGPLSGVAEQTIDSDC